MDDDKPKTVILIGAGILSSTVGSFLKHIEPDWNIKLFERLDQPGMESSNERHNAGTGHAALCELNYTVEQEDGSIDIEKAKEINEQFEVSRQFWAFLINNGEMTNPGAFIRRLPHISFVQGADDVNFLRKRYEALSPLPMFEGMEYSEDHDDLKKWMPLMMEGRASDEVVAASRMESGTDVNFGELTRQMMKSISGHDNAEVHYNHEVLDFKRRKNGKWEVKVRNIEDDKIEYHTADYIFIGAGGNAIPLLQKTKIPESRNLGGFPISGAFLMCTDPEVVGRHGAKVYGKEPPNTPPMTVPHLDRRYIQGEQSLLFGPFAAIGPKFLKHGSNTDLFKSINANNMLTMLSAGIKNGPLVKYSIGQVMMDKSDRMKALRKFVPDAKDEDWDLMIAGKRVQVIKDTDEYGKGYIQFGTEVVHSGDNSVVALLGESPGASISVSVALEVFEKNFPEYMDEWSPKIKEAIPSFGYSLIEDSTLLKEIRKRTSRDLGLE